MIRPLFNHTIIWINKTNYPSFTIILPIFSVKVSIMDLHRNSRIPTTARQSGSEVKLIVSTFVTLKKIGCSIFLFLLNLLSVSLIIIYCKFDIANPIPILCYAIPLLWCLHHNKIKSRSQFNHWSITKRS